MCMLVALVTQTGVCVEGYSITNAELGPFCFNSNPLCPSMSSRHFIFQSLLLYIHPFFSKGDMLSSLCF